MRMIEKLFTWKIQEHSHLARVPTSPDRTLGNTQIPERTKYVTMSGVVGFSLLKHRINTICWHTNLQVKHNHCK